jgi:hypothetical protein
MSMRTSTMCMGYAKEFRAWACEEAGSQRDSMMAAWGRAFEESFDPSGPSVHFPPGGAAVMPENLSA